MTTAIINARLIVDGAVHTGRALVYRDGRILDLPAQDSLDRSGLEVIDAHGAYVSAGWIELHTHGIAGYDFMDADSQGARRALQEYARHGVTGVYPTTMSAPFAEVCRALDSLNGDFPDGARLLGIHLEGPYFSLAQCGAQPPDRLCAPEDGEYRRLCEEYPLIARIDAAPELAGSAEMARYLTAHGIAAGIAHTDANATTTFAAIDAGCRIATHLYSGMSGVHRENGFRYGGAVEACLLRDEVYCEAICDGIHLPAELLALIYKIKGAQRMVLVSDSMRGAGLADGARCMLGAADTGTPVVVADGVAWLPDRSAFAGSVATAERLLRTATQIAGIPLPDAVTMMTAAPARAMGRDDVGELRPGYHADITVFDDDINVLLTVVGGEIRHSAKENTN